VLEKTAKVTRGELILAKDLGSDLTEPDSLGDRSIDIPTAELGFQNILDDIVQLASFGLNCGFFSARWIQDVLYILLERLAIPTSNVNTSNATLMKTNEVHLEQRGIIRTIQNKIVLLIDPSLKIHNW
jgi:hypothetical protein